MKNREAEEQMVARLVVWDLDKMTAAEVIEVRNWLYATADGLTPSQFGKRYVARKWLWRVKEEGQ